MPAPVQPTRREFLDRTLRSGALTLLAGAASPVGLLGAADATEGTGWKIGCYTRPWDQFDYRVALDAIAEAGFKYVGLMTTQSRTRLVISSSTTPDEARTIGEEVKKRHLTVASVYAGGLPVDKSLRAGIDALRRIVDSCAAAGAESLLMGGIARKELYDPYYKAIAECCDYARERRVAIALKPHGGMNATGPQCRKALAAVGHSNFTLWYDPGNIYYYSNGKLDPVEDSATVDGLVTGMCVKDYVPPKNVLVTPGTGKVDFPGVLKRLEKGGFSHGPLIIETLTPGDLPGLLREARKAREYVEKLTNGASGAGTERR